MELEQRIKRLEDAVAKIIWENMVDSEFRGVCKELREFQEAVAEERVHDEEHTQGLVIPENDDNKNERARRDSGY